MEIYLEKRAVRQIRLSATDAIDEGDTETLREDIIDAFSEENIEEIERRIDSGDFYDFLSELIDEWSGDDVDELLRSGRASGVVISSVKVSRERMLTIKKTCDAHRVPLQYFSIGFNNASFVESAAPGEETLVHASPSGD